MNILFGALFLLAVGAWLSYVCRECSGLQVLFALGCGAVLGIAAVIAVTLIVDVDPARLANPLGKTFSVLVAGLVLFAVMRLLAALFSPAVRASIAAHEVAHAVWFGAAISIGAFTYLYQVNLRSFLVSPNPWAIRGLQRPRHQGRTMEEWFRALRTDTNSTEQPLRIVRVIYNYEPKCDAVEVPLSWDLMRKSGLFELIPATENEFHHGDALFGGGAKLYVIINGGGRQTGPCWRAADGNSLLALSQRELKPGTNEVEVEFHMYIPYGSLSVTGPRAQVELHPRGWVRAMNDTKWEELRRAMSSLSDLRPKWRTKGIQSWYVREWDGDWLDWSHQFGEGYPSIEWMEIMVTSTEQNAAVVNALRALHVPSEKTEQGYRVFGYAEPGKLVNYIE